MAQLSGTNFFNKLTTKEYIFLFLILGICITSFIISLEYIRFILVIEIFLLMIFALYLYYFINNLAVFLIVISIIPLIDLSLIHFYKLSYLALQNIPLYIFFFLFLATYLNQTPDFSLRLPYLLKIVLLYECYSVILFFLGLANGAPVDLCFNELYQSFYFFLAIPIYYFFRNRSDYKIALFTVVIVFVLVCIEYIILNTLSSSRVTTFHNHFLPFIVAAVVSALIFKKSSMIVKIQLIILFIIITWGSIATETRTLIIANIVSLIVLVIFYIFRTTSGIKKIFNTIAMIIFVLMPLFLIKGDKVTKIENPQSTEARIESISDPQGDLSFLMRVEANYLGIQKFKMHPLIGEGFGFNLQMKWLLKSKYLYPDNSFLYYLLKGGVIFFIIAVWMYFSLLKQSYKVFKLSNSEFGRYMALAILTGMIGILLTGMLNANLVRFKLNLIYALFFAFIAFEYEAIEHKNE